MLFGSHPTMHDGACSLCGSMVPRHSFDCQQCGAGWYSWQGPIVRTMRLVLSVPALFFMVFGAGLLVMGLINQASLATIEYFGIWIAIGVLCRVLAGILPNNHSGWYQT